MVTQAIERTDLYIAFARDYYTCRAARERSDALADEIGDMDDSQIVRLMEMNDQSWEKFFEHTIDSYTDWLETQIPLDKFKR